MRFSLSLLERSNFEFHWKVLNIAQFLLGIIGQFHAFIMLQFEYHRFKYLYLTSDPARKNCKQDQVVLT